MDDIYDTGCMFRGCRVMLAVPRNLLTKLAVPHEVYEYNAWITSMMEAWNRDSKVGDIECK